MKYRVPLYLRTIDYDNGYVIIEANNADEARLIVLKGLEGHDLYDEIVWDERPDQVDAGVHLDTFEPTTLVDPVNAVTYQILGAPRSNTRRLDRHAGGHD